MRASMSAKCHSGHCGQIARTAFAAGTPLAPEIWTQKFRKLPSSELALATWSSGIGTARRLVVVIAGVIFGKSRTGYTGVWLTAGLGGLKEERTLQHLRGNSIGLAPNLQTIGLV